MKSILITGGSGFIGSHISLLLLEQGYNVFVIDSLLNSSSEVIKKIKDIYLSKNCEAKNGIYFFRGDLKNISDLDQFFEYIISKNCVIEAVFHLAGLKSASNSIRKPLHYWNNNLISTLNLMKIMSKYSCKKLIFSSSAIVYSHKNKFPLTEESIINPINPYGRTKQAIENLLFDLANSKNLNLQVICLRYFNPIGAYQTGEIGENSKTIPENLFPLICEVAAKKVSKLTINGNDWPTKDGTCIRDYIHIMDLAEAHIKSLDYLNNNKDKFLVFNVGTGKGVSVLELVKTFEKANNIRINYVFGPRREGDSAVSYANCDLAFQKLNWTSKRNLYEMCIDGWNWYQNINN